MGEIYGEGPFYTVKAVADNHASFGHRRFEGSHALSDASDYFDALKTHPEAVEVWMTRLDGGDWVYVELLKRDESGEWQDAKPAKQ